VYVEQARAALGEAGYAAAWAAGQALTLDEAIAYARDAPDAACRLGAPRPPK
jgi:hypothetical protein